MDSDNVKEETELISRSHLHILRKKKIHEEIKASLRLLEKKIEPLEVADEYLHNIFKLMKDGISRRYPELNEKELQQKIRDTLSLTRRIKAGRKKGRNIG